MTGTIVKGIAGFYYVATGESGIYECKAKGIFRKEGKKPLVGDAVRIRVLDEQEKEASIEELLPRKNELYRPAVANVDQVLFLMALADPEPNFGILDRMLIQMERLEIPVVIVFNKCDLVSEARREEAAGIYRKAGYSVICTSVKQKMGIEEVKELLPNRTTVIAGPSGAGKSSTVNLLAGEDHMETGETSAKLKKGKHTTRHSELLILGGGTYLCDTPGFTSFSPERIEKEELRQLFPEMRKYEGQCRFHGCVHVNEPDCAVKQAAQEGEIAKERYASYVRLFKELEEQEKNRYR